MFNNMAVPMAKPWLGISKTLQQVTKCTDHPEKYLESQPGVATDLRKTTKVLYDLVKQAEDAPLKDTLLTLLIDGFDDEQIWQEIDVQNSPCITSLLSSVSQVVAGEPGGFGTVKAKPKSASRVAKRVKTSTRVKFTDELQDQGVSDEDGGDSDVSGPLGFGEGVDGEESDEDKEMIRLLDQVHGADVDGEMEADDLEEESDDNEANDEEPKQPQPEKKNQRWTVVDDKFFKISELEEFLDTEDLREERRIQREAGQPTDGTDDDDDDDEELDMFADEDDDAEQNDACFGDFFDQPAGGGTPVGKGDEDGDESEMEEALGGEDDSSSEGESIGDIVGNSKEVQLSAFEKRQLKITEKIRQLETVNTSEKPWQLVGEVASGNRPQNSLLAETLDYEQTSKLPPVITEETTLKLEDLVKQRIRDKAWDDVARKEKPQEDGKEYKKRLVLDQEKSQLSLSQVYEQEYMKKSQVEKEDERDPQHEVVEKMMSSLFTKLDALSNYHYTPKAAIPDVKIVSNLPSIAVEEVMPASVSDAALLAPEEVQAKTKGEVKGDTEKTVTDRKRERREKKARQKVKAQDQEKKQKATKEKAALGGVAGKKKKAAAMKDLSRQAKSSKGLTILEDNKSAKQPNLTSSKNFFTQLQEEVTTQIQTKKALAKKRKVDNVHASKYML